MAETLFIRLASQAQQPVHWLIWSYSENEIIASGELANAEQLGEISTKAKQRKVVALVPASDVALSQLAVPAKSQRAMQMAAPYMLEDDLAQDIEQLFFAYANRKSDKDINCFVAAVERQQMQLWLSWLADADISCSQMLPDALALPQAENAWTGIKLGQQYLIKQKPWQAITLDENLWPLIAKQWLTSLATTESEDESLTLNNYSEFAVIDGLTLAPQPEELPMALLAQHANQVNFNLLQGEFQLKTKRSPLVKSWLMVAGIAAFALLLQLGFKSAKLYQLNQQQAAVEQQIIDRYKQAFPESKRVRVATVRSQLKQKLTAIGSTDNQAEFLALISRMQPAFTRVPALKPESLRYDGKRQELRMQATAKNYQQFEQFKNQLERLNFTVNQGSQNNQGDQVTGSFSIKG